MLNFNNLKVLDNHITFISWKLGNTKSIFLVGWGIRDILLWIEKNPTDIDLTLAWNPLDIYKNINKNELSHFMTEKYGTITLIPKNEKLNQYNYEITPLRTEWNYSDSRHPDEITRSNDILEDAKRRDFSVNCIYYTTASNSSLEVNKNIKQEKVSNENLLKTLKKQGFIFCLEDNLLILQKHKHIEKLFPEWDIDKKYINYLWNTTNSVLWEEWWEKNNLKIIIDPYLGIQDLIDPKIKAVWDSNKRFQEDALRIIRALRFVSVLNQKLKNINKKNKTDLFDIDNTTWTSLKENASLIKNIAKERIKDEITKVFKYGNPFAFISLLDEAKLLELIFPSLQKNKYSEQPTRYHPFDTYTHTLLTLYELQKINKNYLVRLAMLYHDVGKHKQYLAYGSVESPEERREIFASDINHRKSSPKMTSNDFKKLGFSKKEIDEIKWYIAEHHTPGEILDAKDLNQKKKLRKLFSEAGYTKVNNLLDITIADRLGQYNPMQNSSDISDVKQLKKLLKELKNDEWQFTIKHLAINWSILIDELKIPAGPEIGKLLKYALERVMNDIKKRNNKESILKYLKLHLK